MFYSPIVILEVNTVNLRLFAFKKNGDFFHSITQLSSDYAGIEHNKFIKPDQLFATIQNLFEKLKSKIKYIPSTIYVILPQCFIYTFVADSDIQISSSQVKMQDVHNLCEKCYCDNSSYEVISRTPIFFRTINYPVLYNPIGQNCDKLYGRISCAALEKSIKEFFDTSAKSLKKRFIYAGESNVSVEKLDKDLNIPGGIRLFINIREENLSVNLCKGKGIIVSKNIDWGANHIYYVLQDLLKIKFSLAKKMASKLNLNINCSENDVYVLNDGENLMELNMKAINDRIKDTLIFISDNIKNAVNSFNIEGAMPIYITGSEICQIRGFKEIMSNAIGGELVEILKPEYTNYDNLEDYPLVAELEKLFYNKKSLLSGLK